jgi:hypothetical protein
MQRVVNWVLIVAGTSLTTVSGAWANYTCPDGTSYQTSCAPGDSGKKCILAAQDAGCCAPGTCNSQGACNIANQVPATVCPDDNDPCTVRNCHTSGSQPTPPQLDPICGQQPDTAKTGQDCSGVLDNDKCTIDQCQQGVCTFMGNKVCTPPSTDPQCPATAACHSPDGQCITTYTNQNAACDDGKDCSYNENCFNGNCTNGIARPQGTACADGDYCHPGTCRGGQSTSCTNRVPLNPGDECNFNNCSHATCDADLNCVFQNCDTTPGLTCPQCNGGACNPSIGNSPPLPCGCKDTPF